MGDTEAQAQGTASTDGASGENTAPGSSNGGETSTAPKVEDFKPPASQEELNRIIADRVRRAEAKYAGYTEAMRKAEQFDAITEAQKSELQRAQERAEAAETRAQKLETERQIADWKTEIAKTTGVPAGVLRGNTQEELLAHADSLKSLLPAPDVRKGAYVPGEGRGTAATVDPAAQFAQILRQARERG